MSDGRSGASPAWRPQHTSLHAPVRYCAPERFRMDPALDAILERSRVRYEAQRGDACARHDPVTCRATCDCRECFTHFYNHEQHTGARPRVACAPGPECARFRELHTVVHTATAAKHIDLLLTRAVSEGFLDVESMFAGRDGVAASYGCGGAADLLGCLSWASRNFGQHDASRLVLRGCDVVPGWFEIGAEGVALTLGDTAPWTRAVLYQFSAVPRVPTDADLMMFEGADIALFSWVLSILAEEGILADVWRRIVARLRPGAVIVITHRWEPAAFNPALASLVDSDPRLESAWGVVSFDQVLMDYQFKPAVRLHKPRGKYRASGVVARVV